MISPWVAKAAIEHKGRNSGGLCTHTSMIAFLANLLGLELLTLRVVISLTFENLILDKRGVLQDLVVFQLGMLLSYRRECVQYQLRFWVRRAQLLAIWESVVLFRSLLTLIWLVSC
jgi:hypothetical protein